MTVNDNKETDVALDLLSIYIKNLKGRGTYFWNERKHTKWGLSEDGYVYLVLYFPWINNGL